MTADMKDLSWKMLGWILDIIAVGALAFTVNVHSRLLSVEKWQARVDGNRWNTKDQAEFAASQSAEFTKLWKQMAEDRRQIASDISAIRQGMAQLPKEIPPQWWVDYVKEKMTENSARISNLERAWGAVPSSNSPKRN